MSAGHTMADIRRYTIAQVSLHMEAVDRSRHVNRLKVLVDVRAAGLTVKDFKAYLKDISG